MQQPGARLLLALGAAALLILVLTLAIRSCRRSSLVDSYKSYVQKADAILAKSADQGKRFNKVVVNDEGLTSDQLRSRLSGIAGQADTLVNEASALNPPDRLRTAHSALIQALGDRRAGVRGVQAVATQLAKKTGVVNETATATQLSKQMAFLLSSDVNYSNHWSQPTKATLKSENVTGVLVSDADTFLTNSNWAAPVEAVKLLPGLKGSGTGSTTGTTGTTTTPTTGLHGTGLTGVTAIPTNVALTVGQSVTLKASAELQWRVSVQNQGDATEAKVDVKVTWTPTANPAGAQSRTGSITNFVAKQTRTVDVPAPVTPGVDVDGTLLVEVTPVAGEKKTDNNSASYPVKFTL